jgi:hypothetical protein
MISRGAMGQHRLLYSQVQDNLQPVIVPWEHALVRLRWAAAAGVVSH